MSNTSFHVDSRIPVDPNQDPKDPAAPRNVIRDSMTVSAQASADTKYDPFPPKRIEEGFAATYNINTNLILFGAILFLLYGIYSTTTQGGMNSKQSFHYFYFVLITMSIFLFATRFIRL
jgi:hypothetical protein